MRLPDQVSVYVLTPEEKEVICIGLEKMTRSEALGTGGHRIAYDLLGIFEGNFKVSLLKAHS